MSLQGKVAFIAGGAKNLGGLCATLLAAEGANIAIHYHGDAATSNAKALQKELTEKSKVKVELYQADLSSASNVKQLFAKVMKDFGKLDIVINTVGMVLKKPLIEINEQEFDKMFDTNAKTAFFIAQEAAKNVVDGGRIITLVTGLLGAYCGGYSLYQGSKAPVEWFTKGLSKELLDRRISVNAVAPGPMDTPFLYGQEDEKSVEFLKSGAMGGRLTKIEDIAPFVKFLCTEGGWITGQTLFASGGFATR